ncbi:CHAT domain-containing protein [Leptolyngbya sp. 7M]|uniref:CHAT domain-containing protein n=1 Tax=Leptolyngbya sp. 7M TaxID=2812896 RepID=UPI001B8ADF83|nr:CHAT domain-containing protein [Leptolyngbya sp. 7M]QYO68005.1 CHAT domain-containing protein [Leptolyngbya sp. 7M]
MQVIKILALRANPTNMEALRLDEEIRGLKAELERATYRDRVELISEGAVRVEDLSKAILKHKPNIVHFSGHGAGGDGLVLENEAGMMQLVATAALSRLFQWGRSTIKCVVLNACYSQVQAEAIHQQIDCVVGMSSVIGDRAAIQFAAKFYQALVEGESFQSAYEYACTALELAGSNESTTPKLLNRIEGSDPLGFATTTPTQPSQMAEPQPRAQQSQSIGNVTISGNHNPFNVIQAGSHVSLDQSSGSSGNRDLQAALDLLIKLKQEIAITDILSTFAKRDNEAKITMLQNELQKPNPDQGFVNEVVDALKQGLGQVSSLVSLVTQIVKRLEKLA